jgi:hypothetical protein
MGWVGDRFRGAVNTGVEQGIWVVLLVAVFFVWGFADDEVSLPVWLLVVIGGVPTLLALVAIRRGRRPAPEAAAYIAGLEADNALYAYYASFLWEALQTVQKAIRGDLPGVSLDALVEQGLLAPAREFLRQAPGEDVRLSVLVPDGPDFKMKWMAGHRLASKEAFSLPIAGSFSQIAFQSGEITWSDDVASDPRFTPHPRAERPYSSIVSVPVRSGDDRQLGKQGRPDAAVKRAT